MVWLLDAESRKPHHEGFRLAAEAFDLPWIGGEELG
jgi:hypothetical protein